MNQNHVTFLSRPPQNQPPEIVTKPRKLRRISRACDFCHKRSIRCKPSSEDASRCQNCLDFGVSCTYNRPAKKRGIKSGSGKSSSDNGSGARDGESDARMLLELTNGIYGNGNFNVVDKFLIPEGWKTMVVTYEAKIRDLVEVYFEIVYPIFPLFHHPSVVRRLASREYLTDQSFFADIMAICAIASTRARDGALFPGRWDPQHFQTPSSESFFAAAKEVMPQDLSAMKGLDWMRICALLALYGIQVGKIDIMHQYLGMYHSLVSMDGLHDEKNWPKNIGIVETELRRRLFWSMYSMEVYSSIVWEGVIRCREEQSHVSYPSEADDEFFSDAGYNQPDSLMPSFPQQAITNPISWLHGWNFTTDLYRILEHAMDGFHRRRPNNIGSFSPSDLFGRQTPQPSVVLDKIMSMHEELPPRFKETKPIPQNGNGGPGSPENKYSFQAANITATLQLVRMILFTSEDATVDQKCAIARDLLDSFAKVPVFFLRAISSPLLHHLAGIGSILGSVMEGPLSEYSYLQVREVLLAMADLLASLEAGITRTVGAASRLRNQITAIDNYMGAQRQGEFPASYPPVIPNSPILTKQESNPNIDPTLQNAGLPDGIAGTGFAPNAYEFAPQNAVNGLGGAGEEQFQFQVPPELLEGFPWNFDTAQGLGQISH